MHYLSPQKQFISRTIIFKKTILFSKKMDLDNLFIDATSPQDRERLFTILSQLPTRSIYSTIGVYANGNKKYNGVLPQDLIPHITYNLQFRPGRAFFVEGQCLNSGYLDEETITALEQEFAKNPHLPNKVSSQYL